MKQIKQIAVAKELRAPYSANISQNVRFFSNDQNAFKGEHRTYTPKEGYPLYDTLAGYLMVTTTVKKRLDYFMELAKPFLVAALNIESTNAQSGKKVPLEVDGVLLGNFTAIELMRLNDLFNNPELIKMYSSIPVRMDSIKWTRSEREEYKKMEVYETEVTKSEKRTGLKSPTILADPNLASLKDHSNYSPQVVQLDQTVVEGISTRQVFSGEATHHYRAEVLAKISRLKLAITEALAEANDTEIIKSELDVEKLFDFLHNH